MTYEKPEIVVTYHVGDLIGSAIGFSSCALDNDGMPDCDMMG